MDVPNGALDAGPEHRFGVLLVHGAGDHRRAGVVNGFGEPIYVFLKRWLAGVPDKDRSGGKVEISSALTARTEGGPAHVRLDLSVPSSPTVVVRQQWILAESLWDASISPPGFWNVLAWALTLGPWLIVTQVWGPVAERYRSLKANPGESDISILFDYRLLATAFIGLAVTIVGAVILTVGGLLLAVISILPIDRIRATVGAIQRWVSLGAGDLYVMLVRPFERAAMIAQVRTDLEWLRAQGCERLVVLAHSQGGAVAHAALSGRPQDGVRLLYTFGSGATRLTEAERILSGRGRAIFALVLGVGLVALWWMIGSHVPTCLVDPICNLSRLDLGSAWTFVALGSFGALAGHVLLDVIGADTTVASPAGSVRWTDALASHDPVLNTRHGRSLPRTARQFSVHNEASFLSDHSAYWRNVDQFVADVVFSVGEAFGLDLRHLGRRDAPCYWRSVRRRRWRVWMLKHARTAILLGGVTGLVTSWATVQQRGTELLDLLRQVASGLPEPLPELIAPIVPAQSLAGAFGGLLSLAVLAVLLKAFLWLWGWWDRMEIDALFRRTPARLGTGTVVLMTIAALALAVTAAVWMRPTIEADGAFLAGVVRSALTLETWLLPVSILGTAFVLVGFGYWLLGRVARVTPLQVRRRVREGAQRLGASTVTHLGRRGRMPAIDLERDPGLPDPSRALVAGVIALVAGLTSLYLFVNGIWKVIDAGGTVDLLGLNAFVLAMVALVLGFLVAAADRAAASVRLIGAIAMVVSVVSCGSVFTR